MSSKNGTASLVFLQEGISLRIPQLFCLQDVLDTLALLLQFALCNTQNQVGIRMCGIKLDGLPGCTHCGIRFIQPQQKTPGLGRIQSLLRVDAGGDENIL